MRKSFFCVALLSCFIKACLFMPSGYASEEALGPSYNITLAQAYLKLEDYPMAAYELGEAIKKDPFHPGVDRLAAALEQKGYLCDEQKKLLAMRDELAGKARAYSDNAMSSQDKGIRRIKDAGITSSSSKVSPPANKYVKVSGEIRLAGEMDSSGDLFWKDVNPDKSTKPFEKSWRYVWGEDRHNTFDPKVYSRFKVSVDTDFPEALNGYLEITLDPWSYVGTADVFVRSTMDDWLLGGPLDYAYVRLKYFYATGKTMNEIFRTRMGNILVFDEIKVKDGKLTPYTPTGLYDWFTPFNEVSGDKFHFRWNIVRKLWFDFENEILAGKVFLLSDQEEALYSDDPMRLSNNKTDWEESPWIDTYDPSRVFVRSGNPLKAGKWVRNISTYVRDSEFQRLTYLRGAKAKMDVGKFEFETVAAAPITLWDDYNDLNSAEGAARIKYHYGQDEREYLGAIFTAKFGFDASESIEARNYVYGVDFSKVLFNPNILRLEAAKSQTSVDEANGFDNKYNGYAYMFDYTMPGGADLRGVRFGYTKLYASYMDKRFYPALTSYRYTRIENERNKHIYFDTEGRAGEEKEAFKGVFGNGIERGRIALGLNTYAYVFDSELDLRFRNVHSSTGDPIETVTRAELTKGLTEDLTAKALAWYKFLPHTVKGKDPLIYVDNVYALSDYFSGQAELMQNDKIEDGKDPSIGHFSAGLHYKVNPKVYVEGVFEATNDPMDFPRLLYNDVYVTDIAADGILYDAMVPFLYDQNIFDLPPYEYYYITRLGAGYDITDSLFVGATYTRNQNKFATGIDDNVNHLGFELRYKPKENIRFWFAYVYSKAYDLYVYNKERRLDYKGHNNFFLGMRYLISEEEYLDIMFGEYAGYESDSDYYTLSALDTQHIYRVVYTRKF